MNKHNLPTQTALDKTTYIAYYAISSERFRNCAHDPYLAPSYGAYADKPWGKEEKTYAAMVSYLDGCVGRLMQSLKDEGLEKDTVVFFASDNGSRSARILMISHYSQLITIGEEL